MKVYITGVSGTGKTTISDHLNRRGIQTIDIDAVPGLCHWQNKINKEKVEYSSSFGKDWLEAHMWVCDVDKLKKLMSHYKEPLVVVGVVANQDEFINIFDKIILLHCKEEILVNRLITRETNTFGKKLAEREVVLGWYKDFEKKLRDQGAIPLNSENAISDLINEIVAQLD